MNKFNLYVPLLLAAALLSAPGAARAAEDYANCKGFITSLPTSINTPGTWCLNQDLSSANPAINGITINTNNVTIDCNDFKIDGLAAGTATASNGIAASDRHGITVRHCNIRGFQFGLNISGFSGGNNLVEDNRFDGNTYVGVYVEGDGTVVRRNRIFDTGGTTASVPSGAFGILAYYSVYSMDILDNTIVGVAATSGTNGSAYGIHTQTATGSINGNRIRGLVKDGTGEADGIYNNSSDRVIMRKNEVTGAGLYGLVCSSANSRAKDNVVNGFTTGILNCADDGNVIKP
jgi:parallel beta-helix repeat protein